MTRDIQEVLEAVDSLKRGQFKATAIKVELEANMERSDAGWDEVDCHDWIMERLKDLGLATLNENDSLYYEHDGDSFYTYWHPAGALKYAQFYNDGSVDSEFTFTLSIKDRRSVLLLPKIIGIFKELGELISGFGGDFDIDGSGMHVALINDPQAIYPSRPSNAQVHRFDNFRRSMKLLLPALYFLGTPNERTRGLEYREPKIEMYGGERDWSERRQSKFCAITYNRGAIEFRAFETCYNDPETILDNIIVIKNCMRYWRTNYRSNGIETDQRVRFGINYGDKLERFYVSAEHVDLLNTGLRRLKPHYMSIKQAKTQRGFSVSKTKLNNRVREYEHDLEIQYREYEERFRYQLIYRRRRIEADVIENAVSHTANLSTVTPYELEAQASQEADVWQQRHEDSKQSKESYINEKLRDFLGNSGDFVLNGED